MLRLRRWRKGCSRYPLGRRRGGAGIAGPGPVVLGLPGASRPPTRADDVELGGSPRKLPPLAPGRWRSWDCRTLASVPGAAPALRGPDDVELGPVDLAGSPRRFPPLAQDGGALAGRISPSSVRPVETRLVPPPRARGSMKSGKVNPPPKEPGAPDGNRRARLAGGESLRKM